MDIYSILSSKPHNPHYLNRYIKFIQACQQKNVGYEGYTENHHICPKAKDMFPEYKCFREFPWNRAALKPRQHFIAHIILWKAFYNTVSCKRALWFMSNGKWKSFNVYSKMYQYLRIEIINELKQNTVFKHPINKGKVIVKDKNGKVFRTDIADPLYKCGEYVGHTSGRRVVRDAAGNKFMSNDNTHTSMHKDMIPVKMPDGSIKKLHRQSSVIKSGNYDGQFKGTVQVKDLNGNSFRVQKTDPRFLSGELKGVLKNKTTVRDKEGNTFSIDVDDPRILNGELVGVNQGRITITDGKNNRRIFTNEEIPLGWRRGMTKSKGWKKKGK